MTTRLINALIVVSTLVLVTCVYRTEDSQIESYFDSVFNVFDRYDTEYEICNTTRDQACLTKVVTKLRDSFGPSVPEGAERMGTVHRQLYSAINTMLSIHKRSETETITDQFIQEMLAMSDRFALALERWATEADK